MWVRIARNYPVAYLPDMLADYRMHSNSTSGKKFITGEYLQDLLQAMKLIQKYLPEDKRQSILKKSKKYYASYGIKVADELWSKLHDQQVINAHIKQILSLYKSPKIYLLIILLYFKVKLSRQ